MVKKHILPIILRNNGGDEWNDAPYEYNAERPYTHWSELVEDNKDVLKRKWKDHPIELAELFFETHDWNERKPCDVGRFSVEQINKGAVESCTVMMPSFSSISAPSTASSKSNAWGNTLPCTSVTAL